MPIIKPDLTQAQDFGNIEPGTYPSKIATVDFQTSKNNNPMIVPNFEIKVGDKIVKRKAYLVINGEGAYGFGQLLRACHFDELATAYSDKSIALADKPEFDTDQLQGQELQVVVDHQMYNGQPRDYIKTYLRA